MTSSDSDNYPHLSEHYTVVREIGRGGMAVVYLATDVRHDRQVAIKVLLPELSAAIGADRFAREIRTLARLQHPHILPLFDSGSANGALYFVMPFIDGESLRSRLDRENSLELASVSALVRQIGDALDYAHAHGVLHRDIKPENILLSGSQALLADFGVARAIMNVGHETLTSAGMTLGTPAYMSPEQASGDEDLDGRSDLYALGCIAYELLSGSAPFVGVNAMATMAQHITRLPSRLVIARGQFSEVVCNAVARMLAKERDDRFQSANEFVRVLETEVNAQRQPSAGDKRLQAIAKSSEAKQSVCVLNFTNIANAADVDWLSGGIAETVSVDLQKVNGVRVVGGDAAARHRIATATRSGTIDATAARELGRSMSADWVIWGAYQKSGTRIRLTPQFINTDSGEALRIDKIDGSVDDIFELQDRIVTQFAGILRINLTSLEAAQIAKPETDNVSAYELYARGKREFLLFGKESARRASEYFRKAIAIDPNYALAWAGLGGLLMPKYIASANEEDLKEGVESLQRAIQLDPTLGEPYVFLAYMYGRQGRYNEALGAARTAVEREPGGSFGWYVLGITLYAHALDARDPALLIRSMLPLLRCRALNPSFHPAMMVAGGIYTMRGQYPHAISLLDQAVAIERAGTGQIFLGSFVMRAILHARSGEVHAALSLLDLAISRYPGMDHVYAETMTAWAYFSRGRAAEGVSDFGAAERDYEAAYRLAEANDHRLAIGGSWVSAKLGLARLAFNRDQKTISDKLFEEATTMMQRKHRFNWIPLAGSAQSDMLYEAAATHAWRNENSQALELLKLAVQDGWSDSHQIGRDPNFEHMRDMPALRDLLMHAASLVTLPAPVGSGGFPDFEEAHNSHAPTLQ